MRLHTSVMACLPNPLLLADFLTSCLDQGGMLGILALNGIFTLVTKHGLEYPAFYARLYALLQVHDHVFSTLYGQQNQLSYDHENNEIPCVRCQVSGLMSHVMQELALQIV